MRSTTELRDQILTAARAEFARHGLAGSRIDRIATAAHASKERLYAHFGDKEALFREVLAADAQAYFAAVDVHPHDPAAFAGDVYDLGRHHPETLRMLTWARLEGLDLQPPLVEGESPIDRACAAIEAAQADGRIDPSWVPADLLVLLVGIGLAWVQSPPSETDTDDPAVHAARRATAVRAAARVIAPQ